MVPNLPSPATPYASSPLGWAEVGKDRGGVALMRYTICTTLHFVAPIYPGICSQHGVVGYALTTRPMDNGAIESSHLGMSDKVCPWPEVHGPCGWVG